MKAFFLRSVQIIRIAVLTDCLEQPALRRFLPPRDVLDRRRRRLDKIKRKLKLEQQEREEDEDSEEFNV